MTLKSQIGPAYGLILAAVAAATISTSAYATIVYEVDERGHGTMQTSNGTLPLQYGTIPDPEPGGLPNAFAYGLYEIYGLVAGDVTIAVPGGQNFQVLRFYAGVSFTGNMWYYSSMTPEGMTPSFADIGIPTDQPANRVVFFDDDADGYFEYVPFPGMPGWAAGQSEFVSYRIHYDIVPAPGTVVGLMGACGVIAGRRRRR